MFMVNFTKKMINRIKNNNQKMKTIFITSFHPLISRNILCTNVLKCLAHNKNIRIIIFCPEYKKSFFIKHFRARNIFIEGINTKEMKFRFFINKLFGRLFVIFNDSDNLRIRLKEKVHKGWRRE